MKSLDYRLPEIEVNTFVDDQIFLDKKLMNTDVGV